MRRRRGFTLIELLLVMAILSTLMGLGVGFLTRKSSSLDQAVNTLRDQVRTARETARSRQSPTQVVFQPGGPGAPASLRAKVLAVVGQWHFEDDSGRGAPGLDGAMAGGARVVDEGRFGRCLRCDADAGKDALRVPTQDVAAFDLAGGFRVRVDVALDADHACQVLRLGDTFVLAIKSGLLAAGEVTLKGEGGRPGRTVHLQAQEPMRLGHWTTLELAYDLSRVRLLVDHQEVAGADEKEELHQERGGLLLVSPGTAPLAGRIDELFLLAYELTEPQVLATDIELVSGPLILQFDPAGEPDARVHAGAVRYQLRRGSAERTLTLELGGILR